VGLRRNSSANFVFPRNLDNDCRWGFALISMRCGAYFDPLALHEMGDDEPIQSKAYSFDVMITIAINIVVVVLGYYLVMVWDLYGR
jgi:hypothetical protein